MRQQPSKCDACERAQVLQPHARCAMHETSTSPVVDRRRVDDRQRGPIGPVPRIAFAYVVGDVPRFDDDGRRVL